MSFVVRAVILSATFATTLCLYLDRPKPVVSKIVPYCQINEHWAGKDERGNWHSGWFPGYGPCTLLDRYEIA